MWVEIHISSHTCTVSTLYWSDIGSIPKIGKASMDGSGNKTVINNTDRHHKLVFTLDISQQVLYWINGTRSCYLQSSNTDGSGRRIAYNASNTNRGGCPSYYYMHTSQAIDFFGGAVYSYSSYNYNRHIYRTMIEGTPSISRYSYTYYTCRSGGTSLKVISRERQLQST